MIIIIVDKEKYRKFTIYLVAIHAIIVFSITGFEEPFSKLFWIFALSSLTYIFFSTILWKNKYVIYFLRKIKFFNSPYINGKWEGVMISNWVDPQTNKKAEPIPCEIIIKQKMNKLSIILKTNKSQSSSKIASVLFDDSTEKNSIWYSYENIPSQENRESNPIHFGSTILEIIESKDYITFKGEYWTSRMTVGTLHFDKKID